MSISAFDKLILFLRKGELIKESLSTGDKIIIAIRLYLYLILFSFLINLITGEYEMYIILFFIAAVIITSIIDDMK